MADTEKTTTLQLVRGAKDQVKEARRDPSLSEAENRVLERGYEVLGAMEGDIILSDISACIRALEADTERLEAVSSDISKTIARLSALTSTLQKVANATKVLVDALSKAATLGTA